MAVNRCKSNPCCGDQTYCTKLDDYGTEKPKFEWKDAVDHRPITWPLGGYAPGGYMNKCWKCKGHFLNLDKRAVHCLPCAVDSVNETLHTNNLRIKQLEEENKTLRDAFKLITSK
jgi:hypothetical protein